MSLIASESRRMNGGAAGLRTIIASGIFCLLLAHSALSAVQEPPAASPPTSPQRVAQSQEEFEAYQRLLRESNPEEQIRLVEDFLLQYPGSALKEFAFQTAAQAYQVMNDAPRLRTYAEMTLAENPDNLVALLLLAATISERTSMSDPDAEEDLKQAEDYGKRALAILDKLPPRPDLPLEQWEHTKKEAAASAHAALGTIALIRKEFSQAEPEFRQAVELTSQPDVITLYRLGLSYSFQKKYDPALDAFDRAEKRGGVKVTTPEGVSRDLIAEARDFVLKAKASEEGSAPSEEEPPNSEESGANP